MIRKAAPADIDAVEAIYNEIHGREESGFAGGGLHNREAAVFACTGWRRGIYPTRETAAQALERGDLYVMDEGGGIAASAVINQIQPPEYAAQWWRHPAAEGDVLALHTLVISPRLAGQGLAKRFINFYENCAALRGCRYLRFDTNEWNKAARQLYRTLGYEEAGSIVRKFPGPEDIRFMRLEKRLGIDGASYEKSCGAVVYRREGDNILVLTEYMKKGHTSIPKGHIEPGETEEETALREIFEETGLSVTLDTGFRTVEGYCPREGVYKDVVFFIAEAAAGAVVEQKAEVTRAVFLPAFEAANAMTYAGDRDIVLRASEYIRSHPPVMRR